MTFVDANVLLEVLLGRPNLKAASAMLGRAENQCISLLTVHLIWHFCRLEKVDDDVVQELIATCTLYDVTAEDYLWALENEKGRDFEDTLQVAVALRSGCETFLTFDKKLAKRYAHLPITFHTR